MLASFAPEKKRQKIDPIHLCFGESGRLSKNIEIDLINCPDDSIVTCLVDKLPNDDVAIQMCHYMDEIMESEIN